MAKKDNLIKSKSIYTIKKNHFLTNDATIYENDHITIISNDGIYDDDMALFSDSNFKYRIRTESNDKKKHTRSSFLKTDNGSEFWTLKDISASTISEESKIVSKPNYSSLKDFAYYGSAVELIRATINDIVQRFPGGITKYSDNNLAPTVVVNGTTRKLLSNEFEIDCWSNGALLSSGDAKNPMRILSASYMNYEDNGTPLTSAPMFKSNENMCPNSIIGTVTINGKGFDVYMDGEYKKHLLETGGNSINLKPKASIIDAFWDSLDDFERVLLNRDATPVYKAILETPYSDETGFYYKNETYIWPTVNDDGFTPDITTSRFQNYLESLISLANFHDEYDSDNIWRMMTHESIKNLNWTYVSKNDENESEQIDNDSNGIKAMIRVYGRQFDDIKRYADNIKYSNTLSYDQKQNLPDYFLSDVVENDGWEAQHTSPFDSEVTNVISSGTGTSAYTLYVGGKTTGYVNSEFQRRLALNSDYIQSLKGTRRGIDAILGMFGYENVDRNNSNSAGTYSITEYVCVVVPSASVSSYTEASLIRTLGGDYVNVDEQTNFMAGYPVAVIQPSMSASTSEDGGGTSEENSYYIVPWFDRKQTYNYPFYFQSKGGWGKRSSKIINLPHLTNKTELETEFVDIYGETQPYMKYAKTMIEMTMLNQDSLCEGTICYVTDISDIDKMYEKSQDEDGTFSHYFILKTKELAGYCGYVQNNIYDGCYGWKNIPVEQISGVTKDGAKVIYLESLKAEYKGNNPHIGYGLYDDGDDYREHFQNLFKGMLKDGKFDYLQQDTETIGGLDITGQELYSKLCNGYGFKLSGVTDNKKCNFYCDTSEELKLIAIGSADTVSWAYPEGLVSYNPENIETPDSDSSYANILDESQANGVVNVKNIRINFNVGDNLEMQKYIQNVVLKYLEEMIPSTAIVEYLFNGVLGVPRVNDETPAMDGGFRWVNNVQHAVIDNNAYIINVYEEIDENE